MEEIDYNTKILNFLAMTETGDQVIASKYLEEAEWDESKAVNNFFNKGKSNVSEISDNININNNNIISNTNDLEYTITDRDLIKNDSNKIDNKNNNDKNKKWNFVNKYVIKPLNSLLNCCTEKRDINKSEEKKIFQFLPNITEDFIKFCQSIKRKIGIIIFYRANNVPFLKNFISLLCRSSLSYNLLKQNFVIYPLLANTNEGYTIHDIVSHHQLLFPSFVFCYSSSRNRNEMSHYSILTKNDVISILESESITLNTFHNNLIEILKKTNIHKNMNNNISNEFDKSFGPLTDAEILHQQNFEMEELEKEEIKKEEELKKEIINEEKRKKEEEIKTKEIKEKALEAKDKNVEEPDANDPNCSVICFRYPDGETTKNRRFLKSHTIQNLYNFVTSLGEEIYTEKENNHFSLYQPFPPKKYTEMDNTLEKEGLFPNAVIQIREEE